MNLQLPAVAAGLVLMPLALPAEDAADTAEEIVVVGRSVATRTATVEVEKELVVDTAAALRDIPGATVNRNGPLTGIAQYRGMFGDRIAVEIDQLGVISGGPNAMDTPLSYMSPMMTKVLVVTRGIASVSLAPESIGGHISTTTSRGDFGGEAFEMSGMLGTRIADNGRISTSAARLTLADEFHRVSAIVEVDNGDDIATPVGEIIPSRLQRDRYDLSYAYDSDAGNVLLFVGKLDTGKTGTSALPMDIIYIDTELYGARFGINPTGRFSLEGRIHYNDVSHVMDNFSLRDAPMPMRHRLNTASGDGTQFHVAGTMDQAASSLRFGIDGVDANHESVITNPLNPMFRIGNFVDVERTLFGGFVEWRRHIGHGELEIGGRVNRVSTDAGDVSAAGLMGPMGEMAGELAQVFNTAQRDLAWNTYDAIAKYRYTAVPGIEWTFEAGRKSRAPSYQELYLWLPMEATGGLADGRTYIGNLTLREEVSNELVVGMSTEVGRLTISPQVYFRSIDDYILGVPSTDPRANAVAMMMTGVVPLKYDNVDAEIWGIDGAWNFAVTDRILLDGRVSMVRGKRTDIDDHLYRLSPFNGSIGLAYEAESWALRSEVIGYASQERVSTLSDEASTDGYWLANIGLRWNPLPALRVEARIDNLFNETYQNHVTGVNRATGSDIPVGERLYGAERRLSAGLIFSF